MPKAVLSNRIYMDAKPDLVRELDQELTYRIPPRNINISSPAIT